MNKQTELIVLKLLGKKGPGPDGYTGKFNQIFNWLSTRVPRQFNGKRTTSSTNDTRAAWYPYAKE